MKTTMIFRTVNVRIVTLAIAYLLCDLDVTNGKTKISTFYHRFIRNAASAVDEKNFIEAIHNASAPLYNHYYHGFTELAGSDPSCKKLCPKVVNVNDEKIGCSVGTEETLKADGITAKTMAHPTVLEAQYGVVKCVAFEVNRTVVDEGLNVNLTCLCIRSTITRKPGIYCGPTNRQRCGTEVTWKDGINTYFKKLFKDYHYQGKIHYIMEDAKDLLENGLPAVVARPQG